MFSDRTALKASSLWLFMCTAAHTIAAQVSFHESGKLEKLTVTASMHNTASMVGWSDQPFIGVTFNYR
jgi:hypothetical protein